MRQILSEKPEDNFREKAEEDRDLDPEEEERRIEKIIEDKIDIESIRNKLYKILPNKAGMPAETIRAMAKLVYRLKDKLSGYDTILSDDASGRLPSLFVRELINKKREEEKKENSDIYFIAAGRGERGFEGRKPFIEKFFDEHDSLGKTLIMTEHIESGQAMADLADLVKEKGIDFDVATVSLAESPYYYKTDANFSSFSDKLIYGGTQKEGMYFYGNERLSGVTKGLPREALKRKGEWRREFARPANDPQIDIKMLAHPERNPNTGQNDVDAAREAMRFLAHEMEPLIEDERKG